MSKEALAQEPVACLVETEQGVMVWPIKDINEAETYCEENEFPVLLYTSPPAQRPWIGLTDEEIAEMMAKTWGCASIAPRHAPAFAQAIEAAHGIKEKL